MNFSDRINLYNRMNFGLMYSKRNLFKYSYANSLTSCSSNARSIMSAFCGKNLEVIQVDMDTDVEDIFKPNRIYKIKVVPTSTRAPTHHYIVAIVDGKWYKIEARLKSHPLEITIRDSDYCTTGLDFDIELLGCRPGNKKITIKSCDIDSHEEVISNIINNIDAYLESCTNEEKLKYLEAHNCMQLLIGRLPSI